MAVTTRSAPRQVRQPGERRVHTASLAPWLPVAFAIVAGAAFVLVQPDVNDLWAARARASAVEHGVGLTYWFSWFGGGTTPGNYSVLTPYTSALVGTELLGALSTLAIAVLAVVALRGTRYSAAASWYAALAAGLNLWSGRVPFLFGSAFAVAAIIAVQHRRRVPAMGLTILSILASPVSGAFLCLGLSGTFLTTRTRAYRPLIAWTGGTGFVALVGVTILFGAPGPEPFSPGQLAAVGLGLLWLFWGRPADHVRTTLGISLLTTIALFLIPNGLGSNFARFAEFCLPVGVLALSSRRLRIALLSVAPLLVMGSISTAVDLVNAARPVSSVAFYTSLAHRLDVIDDLDDYRVEVVNHGAHAGYDALLDHALLARGWETQEDNALNASLLQDPLDAVTYKVWLDNNAVGYVALPSSAVQSYPEYTLVQKHRPAYLQPIWADAEWQLFRVRSASPIVGRPASVIGHDQKSMTIEIPCTCTIAVRIRWSRFLTGTLRTRARSGQLVDAAPTVAATVGGDGSGWTTLTTRAPGTYVLRGSLRGLLR